MAKDFVEKGEEIGDAIFQAAYFKRNIELVIYLIKKGGKVDGNTVNGAANAGNFEMLKYLTNENGMLDENGKKIHDSIKMDDNVVGSAAWSGSLPMLKYLIDEKNMNIDDYAVSNAAAGNHFDVIKYLFGDEVRDEQGNVYKLPEKKITKIANSKDDWYRSWAMNSAFKTGNIELIKYLAKKLKSISPEQHERLLTMISQGHQ